MQLAPRRSQLAASSILQIALALAFGAASLSNTAMAQTPAASATASDSVEIQRLIKEGQHGQALKLIDESLARNPKDPQMRFRRGVALSMLDRKAEALAVFQKLVDDHPEMPAPYNNLAVLYGAQGDYDKARGALERAIRTNPAYATAYQNLGDVYAQLASQAYSKALQLDKTDATVPPKLALLRELTSGPTTTPTAAVAAKKDPAPVQVAAAKPTPTPAPTPAPVATPPASTSVPAAKPTATPSVTPTPAPAQVASAAAAATKPAPAAQTKPAANPAADIESAVQSWASAWSRRDMNGYFAAYSSDFNGNAGSRKAWEQDRRDRISTRKDIKVSISDLKVAVNGDKATARFRQAYSSDKLSTNSRKTLELSRTSSGKWVIKQETSGG
ncbi:MAG: DUF4440 domain-containing protein [Burkholderiales bacterium PBB6]|nr:MAG: DUF4440 domain-containing protein [Burkholderiales bacterium PBB6]